MVIYPCLERVQEAFHTFSRAGGVDCVGGLLQFQLQDPLMGTGTASVYLAEETAVKSGKEIVLQQFVWNDLDPDVRHVYEQGVAGRTISHEEHDVAWCCLN